jgi:hypothetical protein
MNFGGILFNSPRSFASLKTMLKIFTYCYITSQGIFLVNPYLKEKDARRNIFLSNGKSNDKSSFPRTNNRKY